MKPWAKSLGRLFGLICIAAYLLNILGHAFFKRDLSPANFVSPTQISLIVLSAGFFLSSRFAKLGWFQPLALTAVTALPFLDPAEGHESMYGLGFFVLATLVLFKMGFYERHRKTKVALSLAYLYGLEVFAALRYFRNPISTITPVFFISLFLLVLYVLFRERVVVYLKEPKPSFSLGAKGLSPMEAAYVKALTSGKSPKEIAQAGNISESTVRNTLARAYRKMGIESMVELTKMAERYELVD